MASSYNNLGIELQATGENAGTWGTKTNTNLDLIAETWGYLAIDVASADVTLAMTSGSSSNARNYILEFTGTLAANRTVNVPAQAGSPAANIEKGYLVVDKTNRSGSAYSLTFKVTSQTGVVLRALPQNKSSAPVTTFCYHNGTDIIDASKDVAISFTDAQYIADSSGNELLAFGVTSSAVNEFTMANAATGNGPILSSTGETNVDININPKGSGTLKSGSSAVKIAGKETVWVPALAMYPNSTNGCADIAQTELGNGPELKTLDFDKDSDEFAQFAVAFPKSWNESTVTFQAFFTANSTNTGTTLFTLAGVALADDGSLNTAFGTAVGPAAKAMSGTANDLAVTAESGAITIAGSPSTDEYVFFEIMRDVSGDTLTADAKLLGIKLFFSTDAANDA